MSSSEHPVALRLERALGLGRSVSGPTKLLAIVMLLPLVDGIFPALLLAGGIDGVVEIAQVGLLVFGGSATLAVILAEMDGTPRDQAKVVLLIAAGLLPLAAIEAALAPTIASVVEITVFERFAALVIAAIAAKTASARIGEYLPSPGVIVGLGFIASVDPTGVELVFVPDPLLVVRAVAAAGVGVAFALGVALFGPWLRGNLDIDRFRFGSAIALGVLPLSLLGVTFEQAPLAVLVVAGLLAFDPGEVGTDTPTEGAVTDGGSDGIDDEADYAADHEREPWL